MLFWTMYKACTETTTNTRRKAQAGTAAMKRLSAFKAVHWGMMVKVRKDTGCGIRLIEASVHFGQIKER